MALAWAVAALLQTPATAMLGRGRRGENFRGQSVAIGMGLVLLIAVLAAYYYLHYIGQLAAGALEKQGLWLALVYAAGLVDDSYGNAEDRGFRGHFQALAQGRLSTGLVKILLVCLAALLATAPLDPEALLKGAVLVLAVNPFNQLDLRPGRALKVFLLSMAGFALTGVPAAVVGSGAALALLPGDLNSEYMLGDAGANLLGALAGLALVNGLPGRWLWLAFIILLGANAVGEFYSFNRIIAANKILRWLDQIGRSSAGK